LNKTTLLRKINTQDKSYIHFRISRIQSNFDILYKRKKKITGQLCGKLRLCDSVFENFPTRLFRKRLRERTFWRFKKNIRYISRAIPFR